ncbi:cobalt-precorrin-6A reductase [Streptomyces sp. NPDC048603]|uniref:cobalt-precorrin-6A reductase n=1 Tax=Streptomyces sp. NPDC048603 TaxID=3365577 RepID=UPI0037154575
MSADPTGSGGRPHVLILGGTTEARRLAEALAGDEPAGAGGEGISHALHDSRDSFRVRVTTSLAGRVVNPVLPPGETRIGGFGGPEGLAAWVREHGVTHLIDATHPFAERMSFNSAEAARAVGVPLLALRRPAWEPVSGDVWHRVPDLGAAAKVLPDLGTRAFLTTGRMGLAAFAHLDRTWFLVRSVDAPEAPMPRHTEVLLARGPFGLADERELLRAHRIDVLVTKDSGGSATAPKLTAAREAGVPVLVVDRPPVPDGVPEAPSVVEAINWLAGALS